MWSGHRCCNWPIRLDPDTADCVHAQGVCEVSTRCHSTVGLSNVIGTLDLSREKHASPSLVVVLQASSGTNFALDVREGNFILHPTVSCTHSHTRVRGVPLHIVQYPSPALSGQVGRRSEPPPACGSHRHRTPPRGFAWSRPSKILDGIVLLPNQRSRGGPWISATSQALYATQTLTCRLRS